LGGEGLLQTPPGLDRNAPGSPSGAGSEVVQAQAGDPEGPPASGRNRAAASCRSAAVGSRDEVL